MWVGVQVGEYGKRSGRRHVRIGSNGAPFSGIGFAIGGLLAGLPLLLFGMLLFVVAISLARVEIRVADKVVAARNDFRAHRIPMSDIVEFGVSVNSALGVNSGVSARLRDGRIVVFDGVRSLNIGAGPTQAEEVAAELNLLLKHVDE